MDSWCTWKISISLLITDHTRIIEIKGIITIIVVNINIVLWAAWSITGIARSRIKTPS